MAIKAYFVNIKDYANLFTVSLNIYILNKKEKAATLPTFSNRSSINLSILKLNDYIYKKFVLIVIKNEMVYAIMVEMEKTPYNHKLSYNIIVIMIDQEFISIK